MRLLSLSLALMLLSLAIFKGLALLLLSLSLVTMLLSLASLYWPIVAVAKSLTKINVAKSFAGVLDDLPQNPV